MQKNFNLPDYVRDSGGNKIYLKVKAGAKNSKIEGVLEVESKEYLKLSIKAPPEDGKANAAIIKFIAKELGMSQKDVEIISGHKNSYKVLKVSV